MNRKWMIWIAVPVLLTFLYGCPKKKPATPPADLNVDTTTVPAPATTAPPEEIEQPAAPVVADQTEDPLSSEDMQVVMDEMVRRGFSPDVYFDYDESTLTDDTRDKLSRNADLLKSRPEFSMTIEGHADERGTNEYNLALGERRREAKDVGDVAVELHLSRCQPTLDLPVMTMWARRFCDQQLSSFCVQTGRSSP